MTTENLTASYTGTGWIVIDEEGGVWRPNPETARKIERCKDQEAAAVRWCDRTGNAGGQWHE